MHTEREKEILEILLREKTVSVHTLAATLYASEQSIRRDLARLEKQHLLKRTYGGASLDENGTSSLKIPFLLREMECADEKAVIGKKAAALVKDGDVVFLDASTSAYNVLPYLTDKRDLLVITNGIKALQALSEYGIACIGTGGNVIASCLAFVGMQAMETVARYNADICFFACRGLSEDGRLTDISEEEDAVRQEMVRRAKRSYMLCTRERLGKVFYHNICKVDDLTGIIYANK